MCLVSYSYTTIKYTWSLGSNLFAFYRPKHKIYSTQCYTGAKNIFSNLFFKHFMKQLSFHLQKKRITKPKTDMPAFITIYRKKHPAPISLTSHVLKSFMKRIGSQYNTMQSNEN